MYLLSHLIFISASSHLGTDDDPYWSVVAHLAISLFFTIWGVRKTFEINRPGGNVDFFKRFLSLSFVTGVRLFVFAVAVLFFFNLVREVLVTGFGVQLPFAGSAPGFELAFYTVFMDVYYYLLLNSFKRGNGAQLTKCIKGGRGTAGLEHFCDVFWASAAVFSYSVALNPLFSQRAAEWLKTVRRANKP